MYDFTRHTRKFNTDLAEDMTVYDEIVSDPLCSIIHTWKEKVTDSEYDEGKLVATKTHLALLVTWEVKKLL